MLTLPLIRELVLDRPVADCFRYLADFSTTEQWDPGVFAADKTTPGAARAGSAFALRLNVLGRSVPASYRLIERDENRRLVLDGSGPGFTVVDTMDFEALGPAQTRLRYEAVMTWDSVPARIAPLLKPWAERLGEFGGVAGASGADFLIHGSGRPGFQNMSLARIRTRMRVAIKAALKAKPRRIHVMRSSFVVAKRVSPASATSRAASCGACSCGASLPKTSAICSANKG